VTDLSVVNEVLDASTEAVWHDVAGILGVWCDTAAELQRQNDVDIVCIARRFTDSLARSPVLLAPRRHSRLPNCYRRLTTIDHQPHLLKPRQSHSRSAAVNDATLSTNKHYSGGKPISAIDQWVHAIEAYCISVRVSRVSRVWINVNVSVRF